MVPVAADADLAQLIEELHFNAWPSLRQVVLDGWLLRFAGGYTRRANSANPAYPGRRPLQDKIAEAIAHYDRAGLPPIFRIPSITSDPDLDAALATRGYRKCDETVIRIARFADMPASAFVAPAEVETAAAPSAAWLDAKARLDGMDDRTRGLYTAIAEAIVPPARYAALREDGMIVAVAVGVLEAGWMCVHSVVTDPAYRRRGHSRSVMLALLSWARSSGAQGSALAVVARNAPAVALYHGLGYTRELYRYHYRQLT